MILTIDIGNSAISFKFESSKTSYNIILDQKKCNSKKDCSSFLKSFLTTKNIDQKYVSKIGICSVVDSTKKIVLESLNEIFEAKPICLKFDNQNIIEVATEHPSKLGVDMIATAIGAKNKYQNDICIIDCGTATTISVINRKGKFLSYNIMPGVKVQLNSLADKTFKLPKVSPKFSKDILGKNTKDAILSGVLRGHGNAITKFIKDINTSFPDLSIILTGGFSSHVRDYIDYEYELIPELIHDGLKIFLDK